MNSGMRQHLNDEQIAASVIETDPVLSAHLRDCAECGSRANRLRASLSGFGEFVRHNAERGNTFWWRQSSPSTTKVVPVTRWAMASVAVVIAVAASTSFIHTSQPKPAFIPAPVHQMSDEALMSEVQNDVQREYPDAFAPVETNAESAVAAQAASGHKKEHKKK